MVLPTPFAKGNPCAHFFGAWFVLNTLPIYEYNQFFTRGGAIYRYTILYIPAAWTIFTGWMHLRQCGYKSDLRTYAISY